MARDTNFYYSFLVLPAAKRRAIIAVWDFCRAVDDAVDEAGREGEAARLEEWHAELARCFEGGRPATPQGCALQPLIAAFGLPRRPFDELMDGVAMDLGDRRYATFEELSTYCYRVASTVGLICLEIFGYRNPATRDYAVTLGMALQLTNILRDVAVDAARGRVYLPQAEIAAFGCSEADLQNGCLDDRVRALLQHQAQRARGFFERARRLLPREDARRLVAAEIMGAIYLAILGRIERRNYDVFSNVVRVPRPERAFIAAATWLRAFVRP